MNAKTEELNRVEKKDLFASGRTGIFRVK